MITSIHNPPRFLRNLSVSLFLTTLLVGCGGGGGSSGPATVAISGTATAPGGTVAFLKPTGVERFFASILGTPAYAAIEGLAGVSGATVELVEVDADGVDVAIIATAITDGTGAYSLDAPEGFTAGTQYIVRIEGTTDVLESRVTSTSVDIDPVTDVTSGLVTDATIVSGLTAVTTTEVDEFFSAVDAVASEIDPGSLASDELTASLETATSDSEEAVNIVSSATAAGEICGTVTDSSTNPLENIRIVARDFGNWVTRAKTKTAADGTYCLNLPINGDTDAYTGSTVTGEYILGAFNRTGNTNDSGKHASEWWSTGGTAYNQFDAEKITLTSGTPTISGTNFQLELGARITGTVTGFDTSGAGLEGVKVIIRDFDSRTPLVSARVKADGTYRVNVIPGTYLVVARNKTIQPYASEVYDGSTGTHNRNMGAPVTVTEGQSRTIDHELAAGSQLSGTVNDGAAVTGTVIFVNDAVNGGAAERLRTNKQGKYRVWVRKLTYDVLAYGQRSVGPVDLSSSSQVQDFSKTAISTISGTITAATGSAPVSQAKMRLYGPTGGVISYAVTNSDGTYTSYTDTSGDHSIEARVDQPALAGGQMYDTVGDGTRFASGSVINIAAAGTNNVSNNDMALPNGGVLRVIVYEGNGNANTGLADRTTPAVNFKFQLRDDNDLSTAGTGTTGGDKFITSRTRGDGSAVISVPAGTYDRLHMIDAAALNGACQSVVISYSVGDIPASTTTVEYFDGDGKCYKS